MDGPHGEAYGVFVHKLCNLWMKPKKIRDLGFYAEFKWFAHRNVRNFRPSRLTLFMDDAFEAVLKLRYISFVIFNPTPPLVN